MVFTPNPDEALLSKRLFAYYLVHFLIGVTRASPNELARSPSFSSRRMAHIRCRLLPFQVLLWPPTKEEHPWGFQAGLTLSWAPVDSFFSQNRSWASRSGTEPQAWLETPACPTGWWPGPTPCGLGWLCLESGGCTRAEVTKWLSQAQSGTLDMLGFFFRLYTVLLANIYKSRTFS